MSSAEFISQSQNDADVLFRLTDRLYRASEQRDVFEAALDAITEGLGCARASILLFDEAGVMRFVAARGLSEEYRRKVEGHTPWRPNQRGPQPIFVQDIERTDEPDWIKNTIKKEGVRSLSFVPLEVRGGCAGKFMTYYEAPRIFTPRDTAIAITIARQVGFSIERMHQEASRRKIEQDLRESEERFRVMSEHAPVMIWMSDPNGKCLHLNKMLRDFWGVDESAIPTFEWGSTMHPDDAQQVGDAIKQAIENRSSASTRGRFRSVDGQWRVLHTSARPRIANGEFLGMIGVNIDITSQENAERARKDAEAHRELLIAELNHRVKNTLSVVQAIAHQTFRGVAGDARAAFEGRLLALARSHDLLTHSNWRSVSIKELAFASVQNTAGGDGRISIVGPEIVLSAREAVALGMAFHELTTNALKYGALSNDSGSIELSWQLDPGTPRKLKVVWRESGGPPVKPPGRSGFGSVLLEKILASDLNANIELDFRPTGLICSISGDLGQSR